MVAWVVINRQHLPRAARGPSQPRKSRPIRALPLAARLFNNPTFKPANDPQFPPASIPILELTPPSSHRKSPPSFHALTWNPFFNPFVFIFMHVMGGYESVWQLQVVAINCARPTTLSQYVVVATNKNRVPTQTRTPPLTEEQNEAIPGNLRSITRPFNPSCLRRRSRLSPRC